MADSFVKMYLKTGSDRLDKRKTRVVKSSCIPKYHETFVYAAGAAMGRCLQVTVWQKSWHFGSASCIGGVEINLSELNFDQSKLRWYKLHPVKTLDKVDSDSGESV